MYWIIDNLVAVIIAGVLVFVLIAIQSRSQDASIETTQFDAGKTAQQTVTSVLTQDFINIGAGQLLPAEAALELDPASSTKTFSFWTRTDDTESEPQRVTYRWSEIEEGDVILSSGEEVQLLEIERQVGATGPWQSLSSNTITGFEIRLLKSDLNEVIYTDPEELEVVRRIDVELQMISPLGKGDLIEEIRWQRSFRPLNLQRHRGAMLLQSEI